MWNRNLKKETNDIALLFSNGQMKPLLTWIARELIKANSMLGGSSDIIEITKAQERKRTLTEIMRLGKKARKAQRK